MIADRLLDHLPHKETTSAIAFVLYCLYWCAVGTTASTMVLALISKSCDSSLHTEATANYLQQLAEFIAGEQVCDDESLHTSNSPLVAEVELVSMTKLSQPQKEKFFPAWLHWLQPKHTPHDVDNPHSIRSLKVSS